VNSLKYIDRNRNLDANEEKETIKLIKSLRIGFEKALLTQYIL
jgi:hypothetical protein